MRVLWLALVFLSGCTTVAQVTTLGDQTCRATFVNQMTAILTEDGEQPDVAPKLAEATATVLASGQLGPRPFGVASPSGRDYGFFVEKKSDSCVLRLFSRQKGFMRYTNNMTGITTKPLDGCQCAE